MAFFDKLSDVAKSAAQGASNLAKSAAEGTGDMIETQKLKLKISEQEKKINEAKHILGELTWQQYDEGLDHSVDMQQQFQLIRQSQSEIAELEQQIADIKAEKENRAAQAQPVYAQPAPTVEAETVAQPAPAASKFCTSCGASIAADARFCGSCGGKQE